MNNHGNKHKRTRLRASALRAVAKAGHRNHQPQGRNDGSRAIRVPADPTEQRKTIKDAYINSLGASVLGSQTRNYIQDEGGNSAETFLAAIRESVQPHDAVEEMMLVQMTWLHARLASLSVLAVNQSQTNNGGSSMMPATGPRTLFDG